jgi:autotransporter-associated beta strand protein
MKNPTSARKLPGHRTAAGWLASAIIAAVPAAVSANSIALNFAENPGNQVFAGGSPIGPTGIDSANWNSTLDLDSGTLAAGEIGSLTALKDDTGATTAATVTWSSPNVYWNGDGTSSDEAKLAVGYLDDGGAGNSFTVSNIPYANYTIYVLFTSDSNGDYTHSTLTIDGTAYLGGPFNAHGRVTDGTGWVLADGTAYGNYARVRGLSGSTITVSSLRDVGRGPITGFIIEEASVTDHFHLPGDDTFTNAVLGDGLVSTFRPGIDKVTGAKTDGFAVGNAPGETHTIRLVMTPDLLPGTYTIIDYDGTIGGAGFAGLQLEAIPGMTASLVDNTTDTSIDVEITAIEPLVWTGATNSDWDETTANFTLGGTATTFVPGANVLFDATATTPGTINLPAAVLPSVVTFDFDDPTAYALSGEAVTGAASLVKRGTGTLTVLNDCDFSQPTIIENGTLTIGDGSTGLFNPNSNLTVEGAGTLRIDSPILGTISSAIANDGLMEITGANDVEMDGRITGAGELVKSGTGTFTLNGKNELTAVTVNEGTILAIGNQAGDRVGHNAMVTVKAGATFAVGATNAIPGDLGAATDFTLESGTLSITGAGNGHVHVRNVILNNGATFETTDPIGGAYNGENVQLSGDIAATGDTPSTIALKDGLGLYATSSFEVNDVTGDDQPDLLIDTEIEDSDSGPGTVIKQGVGTMKITKAATFTGTLDITGGTVLLTDDAALDAAEIILAAGTILDVSGTSSLFAINATQTLSGNGTIAGNLDFFGNLAPGASSGTLTATGTVNLWDAATYTWGASSWDAGAVAGTDYDLFIVDTLDISADSTNTAIITIEATDLVNFHEADRTFTIVQASTLSNFSPDAFVIDDSMFAAATGATGTWKIQANGNNIELVYTAGTPSGYAGWTTRFAFDPGEDAPNLDPDGDGLENGIEFIVGGDPLSAMDLDKLPTGKVDADNFIYTFRQTTASLVENPFVEYGSDLVGWTPAEDGVDGVTIAAGPDAPDGMPTVVVTIPRTLATDGKLFTRLKLPTP